ncbi:hypothetical protein DL93DRAFT_1751839 [Clavulina sp. PMI_390]|nr:hypothetical protein DL93DRAFT_1751839 [Clavulina sp. PMI_390]
MCQTDDRHWHQSSVLWFSFHAFTVVRHSSGRGWLKSLCEKRGERCVHVRRRHRRRWVVADSVEVVGVMVLGAVLSPLGGAPAARNFL